jgi:AcrR family transcriptional regulator
MRARLLDAGLRLFAEKGFRETTVGEIEASVGLAPRRGALYKHFPSKQALLEAAVQRHLDAVDAAAQVLDDVPAGDVRTEAHVLATWLLRELDAERNVIRTLEQDGDRLPTLRDRMREQVSDAGYRATAELLRRWWRATVGAGDDGTLDVDAGHGVDLDALAVLVLGPLINLRRSTWTFARAPLGLDDGRVVDAWADLCERLVRSWTPATAQA